MPRDMSLQRIYPWYPPSLKASVSLVSTARICTSCTAGQVVLALYPCVPDGVAVNRRPPIRERQSCFRARLFPESPVFGSFRLRMDYSRAGSFSGDRSDSPAYLPSFQGQGTKNTEKRNRCIRIYPIFGKILQIFRQPCLF